LGGKSAPEGAIQNGNSRVDAAQETAFDLRGNPVSSREAVFDLGNDLVLLRFRREKYLRVLKSAFGDMRQAGTTMGLSDILLKILIDGNLKEAFGYDFLIEVDPKDVLIQPSFTAQPNVGAERGPGCSRPSKQKVSSPDSELRVDLLSSEVIGGAWVI
jgi:hypothetical protein